MAGGIYGGTLEPGLGVVDLSGKPPADAERARWFKDLKEGRQRPVSFKTADNTFVHGFVHIDAKGNQHIVVVSNNPDKDFEASFAAALGLPKDSYTMEKLGVLSACKGMSEAGLAKWLFSYCAANGGGTKETLKKFQKHVQSLGNQGIVDFSEARRVRELHRELAKQPSTKAPQVHTDLNETLINEDLLLLDPTARDVIEKQTADPSEAIDPEVEPPTATSNLTGPFITEQLMKVSGTRRPVDVCKALEQPV